MPARDKYHDTVRNALLNDGWTIAHDPLRIRLRRGKNLYVDLGAEKDTQKIAVEIKSFNQPSEMDDLEEATGQFVLYERLLKRYEPERTLYLAVTETVRRNVFDEEAGQVW
jgi:hypothetical protein